ELGAAVTVVPEDVLVGDAPVAVVGGIRAQSRDLLLNCLRLRLALGRDPHVKGHPDHHPSPAGTIPSSPSAGGGRTPDPIAIARRAAPPPRAESSRSASLPRLRAERPSARELSNEATDQRRWRSGLRHQSSRSRPDRLTQNLSVAIKPLRSRSRIA